MRITFITLITLLCIPANPRSSSADDATPLTLHWADNFLTISGDHLPGGEIKVNYLEAYCRDRSTDADWGEHTYIGHETELIEASDDGTFIKLECHVADGLVVTHEIRSTHDEVDFQIHAHNPTDTRSDAHWAQPCIRLDRFTGCDQTSYLAKGFVFLDDELTMMPTPRWSTEARYVPGQVWAAPGVDRRDVNPRPLHPDVPSNGLIGCYSADDSMLFATAFEPYQELFQGVIVCLHSDFRLGGLELGASLDIRGKIYIVPSDVDALLARYAADFPEHLRAAGDAEWTGWLGPQRNGWVDRFEPPALWPTELSEDWKVEVGTGYGTPIVVGDRVFQHARQGENEVVWCLDLETGDVVWRKEYAAPFQVGGGAERHGPGPKSCPAFADGRLFTLSIGGLLSAWDADSGAILWQCDYSDRFEKTNPYWGASTSPLVDGGRVVVHFGNDEQGALIALDVATGDEAWSQGNDGASYASPILVEIDGVRQIVELNMRALVSVDSATGEFLWEYPYPQVTTDQNMVTPAFHEGLIIQGGENRGVLCLEPRRQGGAWTVEPRWHQEEVALDMSTAIINDGLLYGFSHFNFGRLFSLDPMTGDIQWLGPRRAGENVTFLAIPDHVVALIADGELQVIATGGNELETIASYRVAEAETWAPPVLLTDGVLIKDLETLTRWSFDAPSSEAN